MASKAAKKEALKLEKLRKEQEARKNIKRQELQREIDAHAKRKAELDRKWKEIMMKIKEPLFKQDIQIMWHVFERAYDKKDHYINHTMKLIDVADDQYQRTVAGFCDRIDRMINKFLIDLEDMTRDNDRRTAELLKRGEDDASLVTSDHNAAETHLQLLLYHANKTADSLAWTTRGENLVKEDEERKKYTNDRENLRSFLENNFNNMWEEYKAVLKAYVQGTADNQKQVRKLRAKENFMADIIASQAKKIANSDNLLRKLRNELAVYESGTKQAVFRDRRNRHRAAWFRMKQDLINGVAHDEKQLGILVQATDSTLEWLTAAHTKTEKILRLAALCRKLETQREKVLPFGCDLPHSASQIKSSVNPQQSDESLVANAVNTTSGLTRMWQKVAKAEMGRRALMREKMLLEHENAMMLEHIEAMKESNVKPETQKCICGITGIRRSVSHPVPIDVVLEVTKLKKS